LYPTFFSRETTAFLWECNVDPDTNKIPLEQLCIELRAGGISPEHEMEVREKLGHLKALDLLDFLTYSILYTFYIDSHILVFLSLVWFYGV
jgi:hypothetical protein